MKRPTIQIPESIHALLSPSKAHMWLKCAAALGASKDVPRGPPSKYAAEGTAYHDVARRALLEGKDCAAYVGDRYEVNGFEFIIDEANAGYAQVYVDAVRSRPGRHFIEVDLEYSKLLGLPKTHKIIDNATGEVVAEIPVAAGTGDFVSLDYENRVIYSEDLKFGRGDVVYASEVRADGETRDPNPQLALYAAACVAKFELLGIEDDWTVSMAIHQPRVPHYDAFTMSVGDLRRWVELQKAPANEAYTLYSNPHLISALRFKPGEKQCRWCPIAGNCAARNKRVLDQFPTASPKQAAAAVHTLDDQELADALNMADEMEHWASAIRAEGLIRALAGRTIPAWKLVNGRRGNRAMDPGTVITFGDEVRAELGIEAPDEGGDTALPIADALDFALGKEAYKPKELRTVAQLQKPLEKAAPKLWALILPHITQAEGKPALERMEDPRPPMPIVSNEFPIAETAASSLL